MVQNSPRFCLGLVFSASSPLMMTLTMCVVLFEIPGSKHRAANEHMERFIFRAGVRHLDILTKAFTEMYLIQWNIYLAGICAVRIAKTLSSHILRSNVSVTFKSFTDLWQDFFSQPNLLSIQ